MVSRFIFPSFGAPCVKVFEENQGASQLAKKLVTDSKSKHIDVRQLVSKGDLNVIYVASKDSCPFLPGAFSSWAAFELTPPL